MITELRIRFMNKPLFLEVINAIHNLDSAKSEQDCRRAHHQALGYSIEEGHLWCIADSKSITAQPRLECISQMEAVEMVTQEHTNNGHWCCDLTKLKLMDHIYSPKLNHSITNTILACSQCKKFGVTQLHKLMYPITQCHPFELLIANYLSLLKGKNRFHNVLLILDTYSQYTWGFKLKVPKSPHASSTV